MWPRTVWPLSRVTRNIVLGSASSTTPSSSSAASFVEPARASRFARVSASATLREGGRPLRRRAIDPSSLGWGRRAQEWSGALLPSYKGSRSALVPVLLRPSVRRQHQQGSGLGDQAPGAEAVASHLAEAGPQPRPVDDRRTQPDRQRGDAARP